MPDAYDAPATIARRMLDRPAVREVVPHLPGESFRFMDHDYPSQIARWNYHPEYEIHLIRKGTGSFIIGDQIGAFRAGHVAIVGPELPHDWMSDLGPGEVIRARDAVIQFDDDWINRCVEVMPELHEARAMLDASSRGIVFSGGTRQAAAHQIELVGATRGSKRVAHLMTLLSILASAPTTDQHYVTGEWFQSEVGSDGRAAVEAGLAYILENFTSRIRMSEAARLALMSEPTFSRYFKNASGLTFTDMVKRLRIANACRLLEQTDGSISSISQAVGYPNLANFNRQFLSEMGLTPRSYRNLTEDERPRSKALGLGLTGAAAAMTGASAGESPSGASHP